MHSTKHLSDSAHTNTVLLEVLSEDKRHHEAAIMNIMLVFVTANAALVATIELLTKTLGAIPLAIVGMMSVVISFLSVLKSRFSWQTVMHDGFKVQQGLGDMGIRLIIKPFGKKPAKEGLGTTDLVHATVAVFWLLYLMHYLITKPS